MASKPAEQLSLKQRRRVLEYADCVAGLAADAPNDDSAASVWKAVRYLRNQYGFSDKEKEDLILKKIELGAQSIGDLASATGFPSQVVHDMINNLETRGMIEFRKMSVSSNGLGRKPLLIFLKT